MPRLSKLPRSTSCNGTAPITTAPILSFLLPGLSTPFRVPRTGQSTKRFCNVSDRRFNTTSFFFSSILYASSCRNHKVQRSSLEGQNSPRSPHSSARSQTRAVHSSQCRAPRSVSVTRPTQRFDEWGQSSRARGYSNLPCQLSHGVQRQGPTKNRSYNFFDSATREFARGSHLPDEFYKDVERVIGLSFKNIALRPPDETGIVHEPTASLEGQIRLMKSVRALEEKLARARSALNQSLERKPDASQPALLAPSSNPEQSTPVILSKDDYLNLVDLYFYSHQSRFEPDSPDYSPSPLILDDYSFELSKDFSKPTNQDFEHDEDLEDDISPLQHIEHMLKSRQLREIAVMQAFVDLLLDDKSSNRALFEAYKHLPEPGVGYLPTGILRLFLQRMSTPWNKSEKTMLRYLSLIDDMQKARLRITSAEWSSAIYLAGRSFSRVTEADVEKSFDIWREMEQKAGVRSNHVTFNILFDIAVRAGKFALAQTVLKEMHARGLRLNRLGRVSLIYYHGIRGDGDGVRRGYRDFVESGEIVDTLVLNCVMAALINAQEPVAAEQVYERMKNLQTRLRKGTQEDSGEGSFLRYPPPGSNQLNMEMASNSLGRVLLRAAHLRAVLPEHHAQLQASMPLRPDHITFRSMISYHATTSGDLDRLTVLMDDMTELFDLPFTSLNFQLLFKGFAVHGISRRDDAKWTLKRLNLAWDACRAAIKETLKGRTDDRLQMEIPTVQQVDEAGADAFAHPRTASVQSRRRQLDPWEDFVLDLAAFPRERLKRPTSFSSSFFPEDMDPASPDYNTGIESETEYSLPEAESIHRSLSTGSSQLEVSPTRNLIIWVIRAYARCTANRKKVEEVWFQVRKLWKPADQLERDAVIRVLRRALRDCDHSGVM